ncbi:hypothetical protein [Methylobacterium oxalidis]|uniref:Uncharacterized protein n=1 Tax=Methylobacterium oxalidis TaxID=944322 RepID=A0A512JBY0_9HYPH|nr:hypothetical protein [Methylobacterium oxalidis]GEP07439.1 hypothetical protein MOX02_54770 [Methylobacterium oxalidis]GJE32578.1 hypothetical protein LDDCCGHA_2766 [Methylobacterium oxalidis]GLS63820.1 hypothetical protein GCM10007888_22010 [Methylobacterium oxalidis]
MHVPAAALIEAAAFTLGCIAIHRMRRHALRLTKILLVALVAVALVCITVEALLNPGAEADEYDMLSALENAR